MYAVIVTGGKQYKVENGDVIYVEKLDAEENAEVTFDKVLLAGEGDSVKVGTPTVEGATVSEVKQRIENIIDVMMDEGEIKL